MPTRRQFLTQAAATALVVAGGLVSRARPAAAAPTPGPNAQEASYCVRPDEVPALIARLEAQSGGRVSTRGNLLFVPGPGGPRAVRLDLLL